MADVYEIQTQNQTTQFGDEYFVFIDAQDVVNSLTTAQISRFITELFTLTTQKIQEEGEDDG